MSSPVSATLNRRPPISSPYATFFVWSARTEITPLLIITKLEQYDYQGATAIATVMLLTSFVMLLLINLIQKWSRRYAD